MGKLSPNAACPCGSQNKYKKCCQRYHKGALPPTALLLMKSRYSAFAAGNTAYIMHTTHPDNPDYTTDTDSWKASILCFSRETDFLGLKILSFTDGDTEAFVEFEALLSSGLLKEKSRFLKRSGEWFYVDGVID